MSVLLVGLTILMSVGVGWSIGANDAANSLGTAVGSKVLTLRQGVILVAIFGLLGALLQGSYVAHTIGKGIVPLDTLTPDSARNIALVSCFAACLWVVVATYWKIPVSTSHSIVGAVAGAGLAIGAPVRWRVLLDIIICWVSTPLGAALLGFLFFSAFKRLFPRVLPQKHMSKITSILIILSGCYVAFSWGANDVANATGVISGAGIVTPFVGVLIGGVAIVIGIVTWGYRVIETIGSGITHLLPIMAFSAQLASAVNVHVYTLLGIPVSTSHSIVGAIFGVGLVNGLKVLNAKIMREIAICWVATPFISGAVSFLVLKGLVAILPM
jgi:PiT family inorganic phosphate transporter